MDESIAIARAYTRENPKTLVIATTDHGCSFSQSLVINPEKDDLAATFGFQILHLSCLWLALRFYRSSHDPAVSMGSQPVS